MGDHVFWTEEGILVPAVTAAQMREVDRIAVQEYNLGILQMMENAGRNLARAAAELVEPTDSRIAVLAGKGGNGGGGLSAARHLRNRGYEVSVHLSAEVDRLSAPARAQWDVMAAAGFEDSSKAIDPAMLGSADLVIDALIGYSLRGAPHSRTREMIELCNAQAQRVVSLDLPSGVDATTGDRPGAAIEPTCTLTLALPKLGLKTVRGDLLLADIGIPPQLYAAIGLDVEPFPGRHDLIRLCTAQEG
jgi:NAD(P)H-hydrate epimerase